MKTVKYGLKLVFGDEAIPPLPRGYEVNRYERGFAVVVSPEGKEYLIGSGMLYPWRVWGSDGLRPGERYIDTQAMVDLQALLDAESRPAAANVQKIK
jgi:hypothetical protein